MCVHGAVSIFNKGKDGMSIIAELNKKKIVKYMQN